MEVSLASGKDPSLRWKFIHVRNFYRKSLETDFYEMKKMFHGDFSMNFIIDCGKFDSKDFQQF